MILSSEQILLKNPLKTLDILVHNGEEIASLRYIACGVKYHTVDT